MDQKLAAKLGMDSATQPIEFLADSRDATGRDSATPGNVVRLPSAGVTTSDERLDHFVKRDGLTFAGTHLIIALWGAKRLTEIAHLEAALKDCVAAAGYTLVPLPLHTIYDTAGVQPFERRRAGKECGRQCRSR